MVYTGDRYKINTIVTVTDMADIISRGRYHLRKLLKRIIKLPDYVISY